MRLFECISRGTINREYLPQSSKYPVFALMVMSAYCIYNFCFDYESFPKGADKAFMMAMQPKPNEVTGFIDVFRTKGRLDGW